MKFVPTALEGVVLVRLEAHEDERGSFARTYCADEFAAAGLELNIVQCSVSFNRARGTLRGLHYQIEPASEPKLVRCNRGRILDVAVDLRPSSTTYCMSVAFELDADAGTALFIPPSCAHGFLTLEPSTEVSYLIGARHAPDLSRGVRWDDPVIGIEWPFSPAVISERDATYPDFHPDGAAGAAGARPRAKPASG